ncbi:MAG TPA: GDP-mannose 4,6-dehydratase [Vicinamibacterales bacterium]|nr:GDP-mannose 4,6-dehydratase [Vicinamibacterales bacterium]
MFGRIRERPQSELTPFYPRSPYGVPRVFARRITVARRARCGLLAVFGVLFNHGCRDATRPGAIKAILDSPELGSRLGAEARREALSRFSAERLVADIERLYDSLLAG